MASLIQLSSPSPPLNPTTPSIICRSSAPLVCFTASSSLPKRTAFLLFPPWCSLSAEIQRHHSDRKLGLHEGHGSWWTPRCDCSPQEAAGDGPQGEGSFSMESELDKVLQDEESQALLKDLNAAAERVAAARRDLEALEKREKSAAEWQLQLERLDAVDSLVAEYQMEVFAAEAEKKAAELALVKARAGNSFLDLRRKWESEDIDEEKERIESGKAATVSAFVGALASLPFSLSVGKDLGIELLISEGLVFLSCALFGVTYRYVVRHDLGNTQLKIGSAAAFGFARGFGQIDAAQVLTGFPENAWQNLFQACLFVGEGFLIFGFAAAGLDFCLREGLLNPFPFKKAKKL